VLALIALAAIKHPWRTCPACGNEYSDVGAVARHVHRAHINN
jgi:uncharacterized C2H2 Zn-finger protein